MEQNHPSRLRGDTDLPSVQSQARHLRRNAASFLSVNLPRRLELRLSDLETPAVALHGSEKARLVSLVAGGARLLHLDQQGVAVAIKRNVLDRLGVPARFALHPELLARSAPEVGLAA